MKVTLLSYYIYIHTCPCAYMADVCPQASFNPTVSKQPKPLLEPLLCILELCLSHCMIKSSSKQIHLDLTLGRPALSIEEFQVHLCHIDSLWMRPVAGAVSHDNITGNANFTSMSQNNEQIFCHTLQFACILLQVPYIKINIERI